KDRCGIWIAAWRMSSRHATPRGGFREPFALGFLSFEGWETGALVGRQRIEEGLLRQIEAGGGGEDPRGGAGRDRRGARRGVRIGRDADARIRAALFVEIDRRMRSDAIERGAKRTDASAGCRRPVVGAREMRRDNVDTDV